MYKLINPNGTAHDFVWGHNIEEFDDREVPVEFDKFITYKKFWTVFHFFPIRRGDFITRNMNSGKIGLYEVVKVEKPDFHSPFGPKDCYDVEVVFCGYFSKQTNTKLIFNGYGIKESIIKVNVSSKRIPLLATVVGGLITLICIVILQIIR